MNDENSNELEKTWSGFWSGVIWFILGFICLVGAQFVAIVVQAVFEVTQDSGEINEDRIAELATDGDTIGLSFLFALPIIIGIFAFVVKVRRKQPFFKFIGFQQVELKIVGIWMLYAIAFFIVVYLCDLIFNHPSPEWMLAAYNSSDHVWLFCLSVAVFGPLAEELMFRGYIMKVWAESTIGPNIATILVSLAWAGIHLQYGLYDMTIIFGLGIILCASRLRTNSIIPAIVIHVCWNTICVIMLVLHNAT